MSTKKTHVVRPDVKEQILSRLKNEGIPVSQLASEHGIHPSTIYTWLGGQSTGANMLELARLRRENHLLKEIVGVLTLEATASKKKKPSH